MAQSEQQAINARALARLGSTLREKYKLERLLGTGGMAAVYGATHRNTKRFAVKVLHPELSLHEDLRTRFLREGYIANSVGHPGAVAVLDDDVSEDGAAFLVMELLDGEPLDSVAHRLGPRLEPKVVIAIAAQTLDVLLAAHARGIVHRDIKPENLFLTREGEVKVLDFGVARLRRLEPSAASRSGRPRTWLRSRRWDGWTRSTGGPISGPSARRCSASSPGASCTTCPAARKR